MRAAGRGLLSCRQLRRRPLRGAIEDGGHCDSRVIKRRGRRITVDLGAQFLHPDTHPIYVTLLEELGLYDPDHPDADATVEAPGSLCIFRTAGGPPIFSSSTRSRRQPCGRLCEVHPTRAGGGSDRHVVGDHRRRLDPQPAPQAILQEGRPVSVDHGDDRVSAGPRPASVGAVDPADVRLAFPANALEGATTYKSKIGLQGNLQRLLNRSPTARVHLSTPAQALSRRRAGWYLQTPAGRKGPYRFVVLNAPPRAGRELLRPLPAFADITALLDEYGTSTRASSFTPTRPTCTAIAATGRPTTPALTVSSARAAPGSALCRKSLARARVHVFKSWAQRRRFDPKHILLERRFKHPLISRSTIKAARALRPLQGRKGLYFSGQYTTGRTSRRRPSTPP